MVFMIPFVVLNNPCIYAEAASRYDALAQAATSACDQIQAPDDRLAVPIAERLQYLPEYTRGVAAETARYAVRYTLALVRSYHPNLDLEVIRDGYHPDLSEQQFEDL